MLQLLQPGGDEDPSVELGPLTLEFVGIGEGDVPLELFSVDDEGCPVTSFNVELLTSKVVGYSISWVKMSDGPTVGVLVDQKFWFVPSVVEEQLHGGHSFAT